MGKKMEAIIKEMERANCYYHEEYLECEKCGEDGELWWFTTDDPTSVWSRRFHGHVADLGSILKFAQSVQICAGG
jgi:hypothetical protein